MYGNVVRLESVSNSNNMGKELKRLRKEADELLGKAGRFHFLVLTPGETEEEKLKQQIDAGVMAAGDEFQVVHIPWKISPLMGSSHIPGSLPAQTPMQSHHCRPTSLPL